MPDIVKHKKFKDDVFWVSYNNPDTGVKVDFLSIKFPENERMAVEGTLSRDKAGFGYGKEKTGSTYETFVFRSSTVLPLETFKSIAADSLSTASGARVLPDNVSSPSLVSPKYLYAMQVCPSCNMSFVQENAKFCPSCGKAFPDVPKSNTKTEKTGVP